MQTTYRVIGFGNNEHGLFNQPSFCSNIDDACDIYDKHLHDPEMDGAVVIRVKHETWEVIDEFGTEGYSVIYNALGVFKVGKTPKLVLV